MPSHSHKLASTRAHLAVHPGATDAVRAVPEAGDTGGFGFGAWPARAPLAPFLPAERARVSFVWWERNLDDPSPLFTQRDGRIVTLVAVWPTDSRGELVVGRLPEVRVRGWAMTDDVFLHLEARHRRFHLGRYDLVVWAHAGGIRSMPTFDSGSAYRALIASDRPEAVLVQTHIQAAMPG